MFVSHWIEWKILVILTTTSMYLFHKCLFSNIILWCAVLKVRPQRFVKLYHLFQFNRWTKWLFDIFYKKKKKKMISWFILYSVVQRTSNQRRSKSKAMSVSIRAEQSTKKESSSLDVWLGRFAMVGFASAITIEIVTGKGLLEVLSYFRLL